MIHTKLTLDNNHEIYENLILQIIRVADLFERIGDKKVFGKKLSQAQFSVLMILKRYGKNSMSQKEIMSYQLSTKGNISIHINNLTRMGYIRKKSSNTDRRMNSIVLTTKGKKILEKLEPKYYEQLRKITNNLPIKKTNTAIEILNRLQERGEKSLEIKNISKQ